MSPSTRLQVTIELPKLYVVNAYVPNAGEGLKRLDYRVDEWDAAFAGYVKGLEAKKPVVLTGDLNCAHQVRGSSSCSSSTALPPLSAAASLEYTFFFSL